MIEKIINCVILAYMYSSINFFNNFFSVECGDLLLLVSSLMVKMLNKKSKTYFMLTPKINYNLGLIIKNYDKEPTS